MVKADLQLVSRRLATDKPMTRMRMSMVNSKVVSILKAIFNTSRKIRMSQ